MHHVIVKFPDTLSDVVHRPVRVLLFIKKFWLHRVHDYFYRRHIKNPVMQKIVEAAHMVKQKEFVHVYGIASDGQLSFLHA